MGNPSWLYEEGRTFCLCCTLIWFVSPISQACFSLSQRTKHIHESYMFLAGLTGTGMSSIFCIYRLCSAILHKASRNMCYFTKRLGDEDMDGTCFIFLRPSPSPLSPFPTALCTFKFWGKVMRGPSLITSYHLLWISFNAGKLQLFTCQIIRQWVFRKIANKLFN